MSGPAIDCVAVIPAGDEWLIVHARAGQSNTLHVCKGRAQAPTWAGQFAAMNDLALVAVGEEPEEASGHPVHQAVR